MNKTRKILILFAFILFQTDKINGEEFKVVVQQVSITQSPMFADTLILKGSIGKDFHVSNSSDSLSLKGGLWNVVSGIYSKPPSIQSTFPDSIKRFEKNVYASAVVDDINGVDNVALHVQVGGSSEVIIIPMESINDSTYRVSIDDSLRTIKNFRARIVTEDGMSNVAKTGQKTPHLQFAKTELSMDDSAHSFYPTGLPAGKWRMFSFPGNLDLSIIQKYNLEDGHVFYDWNPVLEEWFKPESIEIGRGYWFKHNYSQPVIFDNKDTTGYSIPLKDYTIELVQGANMVGSPFSFPVRAIKSEGVLGPFVYGEGDKEGWRDTTVFEPWAGYAVFSTTSNGTITFQPFDEVPSAPKRSGSSWILELDLVGDKFFDRAGAIGRKNKAEDREDIFDLPILPSPESLPQIALDVNKDGDFSFNTDFRSLEEFNGLWDVQLQIGGQEGPLYFKGSMLGGYPRELQVTLVDIPNRNVIEDFTQGRLDIDTKLNSSYDIKIIAGERSYVVQMVEEILADIPEQYSLSQNYPNPFNPITNINYSVPRSGSVTLAIYNIMGQRVTTLVSGNMKYGYHSVVWNGLDQSGRQVSSGVYFSELSARGFRQTKKMLLLK